jgi:parallel beta-helix repeat protein
MKRAHLVSFFALALLAAACGSSDDDAASPGGGGGSGSGVDLCAGVTAPCTAFPAGTKEEAISSAFVTAAAGQTFVFGEGTFSFKGAISVEAQGITIRGAGMDKTVLDFSEQVTGTGSEGITASASDGFLIEELGVKNTKGDGIKVTGSTGVTFRKVKVEWNTTPSSAHGAYGLYPVQCKNILIEDSVVSGASDAGVYVGQSETIVVRRNRAEKNVAGIEIENSHFADVYENTAENNTGGILVFSLPGLQVPEASTVRVYKNTTKNNNTKNFAPPGNTVGKVPTGTGMLVMAATDVEVFDNVLDGNATMNMAVVSYLVTQIKYEDPNFYPIPKKVFIHDNTFVGGGDNPDALNDMGTLLAQTKDKFPGGVVADVVYDGIYDPAVTGGDPKNPMVICLKGNTDATFANLDAETFDVVTGFPNMSTDTTPHECELPALPAVTLP